MSVVDLKQSQFQMLVKLAKQPDANADDGLAKMLSTKSTDASPMMQQLAEVLARKRSQEQAELTEAAAEVILNVIAASDNEIEIQRAENAHARRKAEAAVNKIEKIAVARVYGERTMNWLPLIILLGQGTDFRGAVTLDPSATEVPFEDAKKILAEIKGARAAAKKAAAK